MSNIANSNNHSPNPSSNPSPTQGHNEESAIPPEVPSISNEEQSSLSRPDGRAVGYDSGEYPKPRNGTFHSECPNFDYNRHSNDHYMHPTITDNTDSIRRHRMSIEELIMSRSQSLKGVSSGGELLSTTSRDSQVKDSIEGIATKRVLSTTREESPRGSSYPLSATILDRAAGEVEFSGSESSLPLKESVTGTQESRSLVNSRPRFRESTEAVYSSELRSFPVNSIAAPIDIESPDIDRDRTFIENHKSRSVDLFSVDESSQQPSSQLIKPFSFLDSQYRKFSGRNHEDDESASSLYVPLLPSSLASNSVVPNSYLSMQQGSNQCTPVMSYQPRSRHFVVIEISNGKCKRHFVQTPELLRLVHSHNKRGTIEDSLPGSLKLRDLRQICSQSLGSQRASIELRRNCILFNLIKVRCIIMHQKLILIVQGYGNDRTVRAGLFPRSDLRICNTAFPEYYSFEEECSLIKKLESISEIRTNGPFEFAVLESLLVEVCSYLTDELSPIVRDAEKLHDFSVGSLSSAQRLHEISDLKRKVDALSDRLRTVSDSLHELLNNEEGLRRMEVSRFYSQPEEWENPRDTSASEDAEILLECYEQEIESMMRQVNRIDEGLDDTLQMIQLHLASIRNAFLKSELGLDVVGTVITFVGALAGMFGMNIPHGFEHNDSVFWPLVQAMILLCSFTAIVTVITFRRIKL